MTKLSPKAEQALRDLREKDLEYRAKRSKLELELKDELNRRLSEIRKERNTALMLAAQAGVPRTQLGKAIGTTNYKTVQDILAEAEPQMHHSELGWSLIATQAPDTYVIQIVNLGIARVSGSANVIIKDGDIEFLSGDEFVLPVIYREGLASEVIASA